MQQQYPIPFYKVPRIPANLKPAEVHLLIPSGFEEVIVWNQKPTGISILLCNTDMEDTEILVSPSLYAPLDSNKNYPQFLFELSSLRTSTRRNINYFSDEYSHCILNKNELLYMVLQHRLCLFQEDLLSERKSFGFLLQGDLAEISSFADGAVPKAYNAIQKSLNTLVILSPWDYALSSVTQPILKTIVKNQSYPTINDILRSKAYKPTEKNLEMICQDLPIHPSSESAFSKTGKLTAKPYNPKAPLYRSVGFREELDGFISIFPPAQNIVARLKTHLISDAIEVANPSMSVIAQDCLYHQATDSYINRDNCLRRALVVFLHMNPNNNRFVTGEIEASPSFVDTPIYQEKNITEIFHELNLMESQTVSVKDHKFLLGITNEEKKIWIDDCDEIKCLRIQPVGLMGAQRVRLRLRTKAGNARLDSNTGLKGVTKCRPNLGEVVFKDANGTVLKPDLLVGMNATKAKVNTMAIAAATLAVEQGFYKPKNKWGVLDSLNEAMVNEAIQSLPEFTYTDEFGSPQKAYVGVIYARFTELASIYGKAKPMSFMFETGRFLAQNGNKALQEHIWKHYVTPEARATTTEFTKILYDTNGNCFPEDNLPVYSAKSITDGKLFSIEDIIPTSIQLFECQSKLLDPEWNKGFYLSFKNLGYDNAPVIRIPSAEVLLNYVSKLPDHTWSYHALIVRISNIIKYCMKTKDEKGIERQRYTYVFDPKKGTRYTEQVAYLNEVNKLLYQGNELDA